MKSTTSKAAKSTNCSTAGKVGLTLTYLVALVALIMGVVNLIEIGSLKANDGSDYCNQLDESSADRRLCVENATMHDKIYFSTLVNQCITCFSVAFVLVLLANLSRRK